MWRRIRRTLVGLAAAGLVLLLLDRAVAGVPIFGAALVCLVLLESAQLRNTILEGQRQQYALAQIRPLLGDIPLDLSGWAADPILAYNAVRLIVETRPRLVVECGSGVSTIVMARCLRLLGGRIISLEHDPAYARRSRELVKLCGLEDVATVVTAPIASIEVSGRATSWYGLAYEPLLSQPIDALLVDGPPGALGPQARYPAVPILKPRLAPACWILMDDGDRPAERAIARAWSEELGAELTYLEGGRGGWLLRRQASATRPEPADA